MTLRLHHEPQVGDVLTLRDGRKRTVTAVGRGFVRYSYTNANGVAQTVHARLRTWFERCTAELNKGGSYERQAPRATQG